MQQLVLYTLCALTLLCAGLSTGEGRGQADDCTSGFTSVDRIDAVLGNYKVFFRSFPDSSVQVLVPQIAFTCNGSILSWTFGARWEGNSETFTELQIWRSSGDGSYTKVGSTTIMTEENTTGLYQYPLSSHLPFQAGDILGFFQPATSTSQLGLYHEQVTATTFQVYSLSSPASQFNILTARLENRYQAMIGVETDPPGCGCGFMSVERMRILLGLETVGSTTNRPQRQQITPDIKFTCDGMITKWIVGADRDSSDSLYPELQVWRNIGNDTYQKRNGTVITIPSVSSNRIYEYDNFSPIPFQAGDILGVFLPRDRDARLRLWSETTESPTNYYLTTANSSSESPFDTINIQSTQLLISEAYHPLVSVEIVRRSSTISASPLPTSTQLLISQAYHPLVSVEIVRRSSTSSAAPLPMSEMATVSKSGSQSNAVPTSPAPPSGGGDSSIHSEMATVSKSGSQSNAVPSSPAPPSGGGDSSSSQSSSVAAGIGGGIAAAAVLLVAVLVVAVVVVLVLRQRRSKSAVALNGGGNVGSRDNPVYSGEVAGGGPQVPMNVLSQDPAATDPYRKFDNPIYGDAAPDKYNT